MPQPPQHEHVDHVVTIRDTINSFVIGNAYPDWTDVTQGRQFAKGFQHEPPWYRWGRLKSPDKYFNRCVWIQEWSASPTGRAKRNQCGTPHPKTKKDFIRVYTNRMVNKKPRDGSTTVRIRPLPAGCDKGYGNVKPWLWPAKPENPTLVDKSDLLLWRYVSKDGNWVMVRDTSSRRSPSDPKWFFMPFGCFMPLHG